jgi:predicted secreted hydrolase
MKSRALGLGVFLLLASALAAQYSVALPGYRYKFPRDYFNHPNYQTEWWYYTGNLKASDGHEFGFELTFFREAVDRSRPAVSSWSVRDLYLAQLALSDISGRRFYHRDRLNRAGPGLAGVSEQQGRVWNGNWQVRWQGNRQHLEAVSNQFDLQLTLESDKPPVSNGINGASQKAAGRGRASHYISLTRLQASGKVQLNGNLYPVRGTAWMDHEFFTQQLDPDQVGWDWLGIQLEDNTELMLFRIRRKNGTIDPYSAGTYVDARGEVTHLALRDFQLLPLAKTWTGPTTHAAYPIEWQISVPSLGLVLHVTTPLPQQEMTSSNPRMPSYWEGAVRCSGTKNGAPIRGVGYLEMTGYARPVDLSG